MEEDNQSKDLIVVSDTSLAVVPDEQIDLSSVIPRTQLDRLLEHIRKPDVGLPLHLQQLQELPYTNELKEQLVSVYGNEAQKLARYMNKEVEVLGMVIWEVLPYMGKPANAGDPPVLKPGYCQVRILTSMEDQDRNWVILRSSSMGVATAAFFTILNRGAWLFDKPILFRFSETNGGMHQMTKSGESLKELKDMLRKGKEV